LSSHFIHEYELSLSHISTKPLSMRFYGYGKDRLLALLYSQKKASIMPLLRHFYVTCYLSRARRQPREPIRSLSIFHATYCIHLRLLEYYKGNVKQTTNGVGLERKFQALLYFDKSFLANRILIPSASVSRPYQALFCVLYSCFAHIVLMFRTHAAHMNIATIIH